MQRVTVIERPVTIGPGAVLQLKKDQATSRAHALKSLGRALYLVEQPVQFKLGEKFGYDGPIDKTLLSCLDGLELPTPDEEKEPDSEEDDDDQASDLHWPAGPLKT